MKKVLCGIVLLLLVVITGCTGQNSDAARVQVGLDAVEEYHHLFKNKRVGIITNHTAYDSRGRHITDVFLKMPDVAITALFGPEHGIRGEAEAGEKVDSENDPLRNIPIYSLYGETKKPTPEMLANVDVLVFDIQDIGARFYTYIWTMALAMEAAAENGKAFVVLDRPNPITGAHVEGNLLERGYKSFVGLYSIPVRHGMTVGELARLFNGEKYLANGVQAELTVVPAKNWRRRMWYDETGLRFIKPSPNIPDLAAATVYPGTCLFEGTNISEGRGTHMPFQIFGAPWIDGKELAPKLNALNLPGVWFVDTLFTPVPIPGAASNPKYKGQACGGCRIVVTDREEFKPYLSAIRIIDTIFQQYEDSLKWVPSHFDRLSGTGYIRKVIMERRDNRQFPAVWLDELELFQKVRKKYLLYP